MFKRDPCLKLDPSPHSPHTLIPSIIEGDKTVLDVGCNAGYMARILKKKKVITDGVDINRKALKIAAKYCRQTFVRDLYKGKLDLPKNAYDYIIFADVLEHLPRPDLILIDAKKYLHKKGAIVISLPNIARLEIRLGLMFGKFDYTDDGILGEDHLRFFTKKSGEQFVNECGLKVTEIIPTGLGHMLGLFDTLTAVQFIFVCKKNS